MPILAFAAVVCGVSVALQRRFERVLAPANVMLRGTRFMKADCRWRRMENGGRGRCMK